MGWNFAILKPMHQTGLVLESYGLSPRNSSLEHLPATVSGTTGLSGIFAYFVYTLSFLKHCINPKAQKALSLAKERDVRLRGLGGGLGRRSFFVL